MGEETKKKPSLQAGKGEGIIKSVENWYQKQHALATYTVFRADPLGILVGTVIKDIDYDKSSRHLTINGGRLMPRVFVPGIFSRRSN